MKETFKMPVYLELDLGEVSETLVEMQKHIQELSKLQAKLNVLNAKATN